MNYIKYILNKFNNNSKIIIDILDNIKLIDDLFIDYSIIKKKSILKKFSYDNELKNLIFNRYRNSDKDIEKIINSFYVSDIIIENISNEINQCNMISMNDILKLFIVNNIIMFQFGIKWNDILFSNNDINLKKLKIKTKNILWIFKIKIDKNINFFIKNSILNYLEQMIIIVEETLNNSLYN